MLPVVLLDVVETARSVHLPVDRVAGQLAVQDVEGLPALLHDRDDGHAREGADVPRLAAALGVEGGAVEHDGRTVLVPPPSHHTGVELEQVRVVLEEALGHQRGATVSTYL